MSKRSLFGEVLSAFAGMTIVFGQLAGCSGGGGGSTGAPPPVDNCNATSVFENGACRTFAVMTNERSPTPFVQNGMPVELEVVFFKPLVDGRYPTIVFHHGSTGDGSDPSTFGLTFTSKSIALYFVDKGWNVAFPQRRGRGQSDGLYDEGFKLDRSSYSCQRDLALGGAAHALEDLNVITDWIRNRTDVDTTRMLVGGTSRGGILSVAHTAERPDVYLAAINFVGGWIAEGCGDHLEINRTLFRDAAAFPGSSLWLYGVNDSFYSLPYSRANFAEFEMAGGMGTMEELTRGPGRNGHFIINDLDLWRPAMDAFLAMYQ